MGNCVRYLFLLLVCFGVASGSFWRVGDNTTEYHERADAAIQSFLLKYWNPGQAYINDYYPSKNQITQYWDFAMGFDALLDAVERTHTEQYYGWVNTFYTTQAKIGWLRNWYDDENWMALCLLRAHDLALTKGDTKAAAQYIDASTVLLHDIAAGWDTTCCGTNKGGIWWDKAHDSKATASNGGPIILATRMYQRTGNQQYLTWAVQWFTYWSTYMVASNYEIADNINTKGQITYWKFTYNSGVMVGAATELFKATKDSKYLTLAHNYASYMVTSMTESSAYGPVLTDGPGCSGDCDEFKGPGYRYMMELYQTDPTNSKSVYDVLQGSALAIWQLARDPTRNLFNVDWTKSLSSSEPVADTQQNVAVSALNLWAANYGPYPGTGYPQGRYEAENGQLTGVGIENTYAGFTGWGYAAGWDSNGESVSIYFQANSSAYSITFRYAAGSTAVRTVEVDGNVVAAKLSFPSTGGYGTYNEISSGKISSSVGWHTLNVVYDSSQGSTGYINLDSVLIT